MDLRPDDSRLGLRGHCSLRRTPSGWQATRLPVLEASEMFYPTLMHAATTATGIRVDFSTNASGLAWELNIEPPDPGGQFADPGPVDIVVDRALAHRQLIKGSGTLRLGELPDGVHRIQIWLPQRGYTTLGLIHLEGATIVAPSAQARTWIAYGSSITACAAVSGPTETWPALVSLAHDWDLRCLGFGGECHLDPQVARLIRDARADLVTMCIGINIYGRGTFSPRSLGPALRGFVQTVRDGHPITPIVVISPIASPDRENAANPVGLTLRDVRTEVARAVDVMVAAGDIHLTLVDGTSIIGTSDAHLMYDGLHPGPEGYRLMAERLDPILSQAMSEVLSP